MTSKKFFICDHLVCPSLRNGMLDAVLVFDVS